MTLIAYIAMFLAAALFAFQYFAAEEERRVRQALNTGSGQKPKTLPLYGIAAPFIVQIEPLLVSLPLVRLREKTRRKLLAAGFGGAVEPAEFLAYRLSLGILAMIALMVVQIYSLPALLLFGSFATFLPNFWLSGVIKNRRSEIFQELPYFIDLITLSVEAGLDFQIALQRVVQKSDPSALKEEFFIMLQEIKMGKTRAEALRSLAHRVDVQDINSFAAVLIQADQLGTSIGVVLRAQADKMRVERFQRAEKAGARAATTVLLPIMLFILPALFLIVFGAFLLSFFDMSRDIMAGGF